MIWLSLGIGCQTVDPPDPDRIEPLPWTFTVDDDDGAVDLDALGDALTAAANAVLDYDARDVVDTYTSQLDESADPGCPAITLDGYGNRYWLNGCGTQSGHVYNGFLFQYVFAGDKASSRDYALFGNTLTGNARVTDPKGDAVDIQGEATFVEGDSFDGQQRLSYSRVSGGFANDHMTSGWLGTGPKAVDITITGLRFLQVDRRYVTVFGAISLEQPDGVYAVRFDNAMVEEPLSECAEEPGGTVEVRDPEGRWLDIQFDGPQPGVSGGDAQECDGCGRAFLDGEDLGEVCADFTGWFAWEVFP